MEYDVDFEIAKPYYRRYPAAHFPMDYTHIHSYDYDERLFSDMNMLDSTGRSIIYYYYQTLLKARAQGHNINLLSVNRHLHRRGYGNLASLTVRQGESSANDRIIYDHFVETILPNMFSKKWKESVIVIVHGLRSLGLFAGLYSLAKEDYLAEFSKQLRAFRLDGPCGPLSRPFQRGWSVCSAIGPGFLADDRPADLFKYLTANGNGGLPEFTPSEYLGEVFALVPHQGGAYGSNSDSAKSPSSHAEAGKSFGSRSKDAEQLLADFHAEIAGTHFSQRGDDGAGSSDYASTSAHGIRTVKIDHIDEQQILDAMSLPRDQYFRRHDIYVLGCFERKKTVYTQQARALTLVHALFKAGKITPKTKIAIVGGGISGMAAAVAASEIGARVVVVEKADSLVPVQSNCKHRWLHPGFYDWPAAGCSEEETNFPIGALNWRADRADLVFNCLIKQFFAYKEKKNRDSEDRTKFNVFLNWPVRMILWDRLNGKHTICCRRFENLESKTLERYDALVPGSGFIDRNDSTAWKNASAELIREIQFLGDRGKAPVQQGDPADMAAPGVRVPGIGFPGNQLRELGPYEIVDCDILIFATGFGREDPEHEIRDMNLEAGALLNGSYWDTDSDAMGAAGRRESAAAGQERAADVAEAERKRHGIYIVSGSGDGALIDILRLCIREFSDPAWHLDFIRRMNEAITVELGGAIWSNRREILVHADELRQLFESDAFRLTEGESERLRQIENTMKGFDVDVFLDLFNIELNDVVVYNISMDPQPFWADSAVAHRLLIWCLHKKNRVRFIRGQIVGYKSGNVGAVLVQRTNTGKTREFEARGVVIRHGVGRQAAEFLEIQGLLVPDRDDKRTSDIVADDGRRLVSLLRLSNALHPETEKFFRHTVKHI